MSCMAAFWGVSFWEVFGIYNILAKSIVKSAGHNEPHRKCYGVNYISKYLLKYKWIGSLSAFGELIMFSHRHAHNHRVSTVRNADFTLFEQKSITFYGDALDFHKRI